MRLIIAFAGSATLSWSVASLFTASAADRPLLIGAATIALAVPVALERRYGARKLREMQRERQDYSRSMDPDAWPG
ncbi:hypothetical protein [Falsiroseomonas sp. HW251]|uniref:hypothetical protein n=1 Tax=Falsiroseomonas sp. HW251 TaxID=3390998 RepID=UPI003D323187